MSTRTVLIELDASTMPSPAFAMAHAIAPMNVAGAAGLPALPGLHVDPTFAPIPMRVAAHPPRVSAGMMAGAPPAPPATVLVRGEVDSSFLDDVAAAPSVVAIWSDPKIGPFTGVDIQMNPVNAGIAAPAAGVDCDPNTASGQAADVAAAIGAPRLWSQGYRGQGIVIGIVDGGVDGALYPVDGGWSPDPGRPPGSGTVSWQGHGNMCAFDALIGAPQARILDYGIGKVAGAVPALLSAALQCFQHAIEQYRLDGTPQILSNSWGLYQVSWDPFQPGDPRNYTHNANHPFTRKVVEAMDLGILVVFAAGNCGGRCGGPKCGADLGPGRSIHGANGHERVVTVGAVNLRRERVGYSSQGPAALHDIKPDVCGYTHFVGHTTCDNGTSAACPVVAGGLALLRNAFPQLRQDAARAALNSSAVNIGPVGWDADTGYGVLNLAAAYDRLRTFPPAPV